MIKGISHITFIVKDLEKATNFFIQIFNAKEVYSSGDKTFSISKEKYDNKYLPAQKKYLTEFQPSETANIIIDNSKWEYPKVIK